MRNAAICLEDKKIHRIYTAIYLAGQIIISIPGDDDL
jgi:hypothetical protein